MKILSRRFLLGSLMAAAATGASAKAPERSVRPPPRPGSRAAATPAAPLSADELIAKANLGGKIGYVVADARTGVILEARSGGEPMAPASTAKVLTTLYAFDRLGPQHRFRTRLVADGAIRNGRLNGDLYLVGGGDPTLDTEVLAAMAAQIKAAGLREVTGKLRYFSGALPQIRQITGGQPEHLGYNPALCGLNLNYNRVYFEWKQKGQDYAISMDARSDKRRPPVSTSRMSIVARKAPLYTYRDGDEAELWTVARPALGKEGGRWLPVRNPGRYAAEVFRQLARAEGIAISGHAPASKMPNGNVIAERVSDDLRTIARDMLRWSTNLTAEVVGLSASGASSLSASASAMDRYLAERYRASGAQMVDHSGLGPDSRISPQAMVAALVSTGPDGALRPILRPVEMRNAKGQPIKNHPLKVQAKTGTLNFVSCLAGYVTQEKGRPLAFAIFSGDLARRAKLGAEEQDRPPGASEWNARAKTLQQGLLERWGKLYA